MSIFFNSTVINYKQNKGNFGIQCYRCFLKKFVIKNVKKKVLRYNLKFPHLKCILETHHYV